MADDPDAFYRDALAACEQGRVAEGVAILCKATALVPEQSRLHRLLGQALAGLGRYDEALASLDRAIALGPATANLHGVRADALVALGRLEEAVRSFDSALALLPNSVDDWCNRGACLHDLKRHDEAVASFDCAIALAPDFAPAYYNRGNALAALQRHEAALASFDRTLALVPGHADAHNNRGQSLRMLERRKQALASFDCALAAVPGHPAALYNRACLLADLQRHDEALIAADKLLALVPTDAPALQVRGHALAALQRLPEAVASYELAARQGLPSATALLGYCSLLACDWKRAERVAGELGALIESSRPAMTPFALLPFALSPALQLKSVETFVQHELANITPLPASPKSLRRDRIRLAYLSADFGTHAVTSLIAGLLERHDRARFDVIGIAVGPGSHDAMHRRIAKACGEFHELGTLTDADTAARIRDLGIDIAVDLTGYTENARPGILARRPATIQISYLGYLGTMAAPFIDYILADPIALPFDQQPYYREKIVHLPDCFLVNDNTLAIAPRVPDRVEVGLPQDAIVLCSFNNSYKFRPVVFDIWMRLLREFDSCVLWLLAANDNVMSNLRREAEDRNVDPARLVFAARMALPEHLARQRLADLFLDTLPYNAGATAAAALWSGVPLLTACGETLVGRMAASMLHSIGLPELAAGNLAEYESMARSLIADPRLRADLRAKLARNRLTHPLFDTDRSRRHIEAAYETMWDIHTRGEPPRAFAVSPIDL